MTDQLTTFEFAPKDKAITLRMPGPLLDAVKAMAAREGVPYQRFVRRALEHAIKREAEQKAPDRAAVIRALRAHERELRALGVKSLSIFGSVARDDASVESDVDIAATINRGPQSLTLLDLGGIQDAIQKLLGRKTDLVVEPARKAALQAAIDRDRIRVF